MSSSPTDSGTPAPNIAPATQVVPSIGLDGKPTTEASPSSNNGGDTFPTAAAVLVAIVAAVVVGWVAYKLYRWRNRSWRRSYVDNEPPMPDESMYGLAKSPMGGTFATLPSQMSLAFNGGSGAGGPGGADSMGRRSVSGMGTLARSRQASWGGDSWGGFEKGGDVSPSPPYAGTPIPPGTPPGREDDLLGSVNGSRASLGGFPTSSSSRASFGGGPALGMPRRSFYSSSAVASTLHNSRTASTFSSSSPHASNARDFPSGNRIVGAPHNPASRIEVVPPSPLAPPPGSVIATDRSTLDFAPRGGIGRGGPAHEIGTEGWFAPDGQEHLAPEFDASYGARSTQAQELRQQHHHAFPPSASSSGGSSRGSSSVPRAGQRVKRASNANLRTEQSANSSDSNLSSASAGSFPPRAHPALPPPVGSAPSSSRAHPQLAVRTSNLGLRETTEPRSPLEKLQMRAEREAKGLSQGSEELQQGAVQPGWVAQR
ncbi:hypothetical protein JCM8208_005179 [Rhodotorula glutinis]